MGGLTILGGFSTFDYLSQVDKDITENQNLVMKISEKRNMSHR